MTEQTKTEPFHRFKSKPTVVHARKSNFEDFLTYLNCGVDDVSDYERSDEGFVVITDINTPKERKLFMLKDEFERAFELDAQPDNTLD